MVTNGRRKELLAVLLTGVSALFCGCPPNVAGSNAFGCPTIDFGFWSVQLYEPDGTFVGFIAFKIEPDGSMIIYTQDDSAPDARWQQDCDSFTFDYGSYTYIAPLSSTSYLEGLTYYQGDLNSTPLHTVMEFIGPGNEAPPRPRPGHWLFTFTYEGNEINAGLKLNSDGSTEDSPVGDTTLGPEIFWQLPRGRVTVGNRIIQFNGLAFSETRMEGSFFVDVRGHSEYGFFKARYVPGVVTDDIPDEQAPLR